MGVLQLVLLLIVAVLASAIIAQVIPKVSVPLVQIGIGIVIALVGGVQEGFNIPPELFLVMFIAPLLFDEAKKLDRMGFWKNRLMILSLAIGLVIAITFAVGFTLNALVPSLGFAAACALGAALGPTDAVAVSSMSKVASLTDKQKSILQGEALINEASGLVAFQFAIALAMTGEFSAVDAGKAFAIEFFGGIALGIAIGFLCNMVVAMVQSRGLENETFHVLFDLTLPFIVYLIGDSIHVSGVLAVVACGIVFQLSPKMSGPVASRLSIVSTSTWEVFTFALNGIVFVLLGIMLPTGMTGHLEDATYYINWVNIGFGAIVTCVVIGCRFIWVLVVERLFGDSKKVSKKLLRHSLIVTFAGAKGAITLSIAMTIPYAIAGRADMIFYASCAIVATLTLANFLIPVLAPADVEAEEAKNERDRKTYIGILRSVVEKMTVDLADKEGPDRVAMMVVIGEYNSRIDNIKAEQGVDDDDAHMVRIRIDALRWQKEKALELGSDGTVGQDVVDEFLAQLTDTISRIQQRSDMGWFVKRRARKVSVFFKVARRVLGLPHPLPSEEKEEMRKLQIECREHAISKLTEMMEDPRYPREEIAALVTEYQSSVNLLRTQDLSMTQVIRVDDKADSIRMEAFRYETVLIGEAYSDGKFDRATANRFRRKVAMMQLDVAGEL